MRTKIKILLVVLVLILTLSLIPSLKVKAAIPKKLDVSGMQIQSIYVVDSYNQVITDIYWEYPSETSNHVTFAAQDYEVMWSDISYIDFDIGIDGPLNTRFTKLIIGNSKLNYEINIEYLSDSSVFINRDDIYGTNLLTTFEFQYEMLDEVIINSVVLPIDSQLMLIDNQYVTNDYRIGYDRAYEELYYPRFYSGYDVGLIQGNLIGYEDGFNDAYDQAYQDAYDDIFQDAYNEIFQDVRNEYGYYDNNSSTWLTAQQYGNLQFNLGENNASANVIALKGFIPAILGTVFAFFFQVASIGVLGISILDIIGALFGIVILLFVIKMLLGK